MSNKIDLQIVTIDEDRACQRIDNFLFNKLKNIPKSRIYQMIRKGEVRINKKRCKADYKLVTNDQVRIPPIYVDVNNTNSVAKQNFKFKVDKLYEDDGLLVINKPAGIAVHGGSGLTFGVIEALRAENSLYANQLELVHRLDKNTSGCLMLTKKRSYLRTLHEYLREGKIKKTYTALLNGNISNHKVTIDLPLKKIEKSGERIVVVDDSDQGQSDSQSQIAITKFALIEKFSHNELGDCSLVIANPITGRTHQIRVHAKSMGCPIIGDDKYGNKFVNDKYRVKSEFKRMFLHATNLQFKHPKTGEKIYIEAPLDRSLSSLLKFLQYHELSK